MKHTTIISYYYETNLLIQLSKVVKHSDISHRMPSSRWGIHLCLFLRARQILHLLQRKTISGYYITPGSHFSLLSWSCNETGLVACSSNWICFGGSAFQQPYHFIRATHSHLGTTHSLLPSVNVYLCSWRWNVFLRRTERNIINHSHACFCWFSLLVFFTRPLRADTRSCVSASGNAETDGSFQLVV